MSAETTANVAARPTSLQPRVQAPNGGTAHTAMASAERTMARTAGRVPPYQTARATAP
jgi:hypothetical protein